MNLQKIELTRKQFALMQHTHAIYRSLLSKFKFQVPDYAQAQEKAAKMDVLLMELGHTFNIANEIVSFKIKADSVAKTKKMANEIAESVLENDSGNPS